MKKLALCAVIAAVLMTVSLGARAGGQLLPVKGIVREDVDLQMDIGGLNLALTYDSTNILTVASKRLSKGLVGVPKNWVGNAFKFLYLGDSLAGDTSYSVVKMILGDGRALTFKNVTSTGSQKEPFLTSDLTWALDGATGTRYFWYYDRDRGVIEKYARDATTSSGKVVSIKSTGGEELTFTYRASTTTTAPAGALIRITDSKGRYVQFSYEGVNGGNVTGTDGRLKTIVAPDGKTTTFAYDANANLTGIHWPDTYSRGFVYDNATFPAALTGVIDESGTRVRTYVFNANGMATSSSGLGGVNAWSSSYTAAPVPKKTEIYDAATKTLRRIYEWVNPDGISLTGPNGGTFGYTTQVINGIPLVTSASQPAGAGCSAASSFSQYDANGNRTVEDDFNGHRVCTVHDPTRNLPAISVKGLSSSVDCLTVTPGLAALPTDAAKTSNQWHAAWSLKTKTAEPRKFTTMVYNGQPDPFNGNAVASCAAGGLMSDASALPVLCKQVEQATTDGNGSQGFAAALDGTVATATTTFTYDSIGRVLTATDPLGRLTRYFYYTTASATNAVGDLWKLTNALNQTTTFTQYAGAGRVLQATAANGVVSVFTYDALGRVKTETAGGLLTTYNYDAMGNLTSIVAPDGSTRQAGYDAMSRLASLTDPLGNKVEYTLDNLGNRTVETYKNAGGTVMRTVSRSYDALGRLQTVVGATQ